MFTTIKKNKIINTKILENPYKNKKTKAGLSAAHFVLKHKPDVLITQDLGEISFHLLKDNLVDVYLTQEKVAKKAIQKHINNQLKRIYKPKRRD